MSRKTAKKLRRAKGEGSVVRRHDGTWQAVVTIKGKRTAFYGRTKQEATDKLRRFLATADGGQGSSLTVAEYLTSWLERQRPTISPTTWDRWTRLVRNHVVPNIGDVKINALTPENVVTFYDTLESPWTTWLVHRVLSAAFKRTTDVLTRIDAPKRPRSEAITFDADEVALILRATSHRLFAIVVTALTTGLRQGELFAVEWADFDGRRFDVKRTACGEGRSKSPKSVAGRRVVTVPAFVAQLLEERRTKATTNLVFPSVAGTTLERGNFVRSWHSFLDSINVERRPFHSLRHTHASELLRGGVSIRAVARRLGHSDPALTLRVYAHCLPADDERAADFIDHRYIIRSSEGTM